MAAHDHPAVAGPQIPLPRFRRIQTMRRVKAVILAAGKGTRMKHLTREIPKPMLPVQGRPILEHIVQGLHSVGITQIFIVTGWQGDAIRGALGDGARLGVALRYGCQEVQDGTGKAPEVARDFVGCDAFLLTYGDILVRAATYQAMLDRWKRGDAEGLVTVTGGADVTQGGLNLFDR
jgi:dTDP-glucose pyrophosphorylase